MAIQQKNRTHHRLTLQSWEDAEGVTGWVLRDLKTTRIICRSHPSDPEGQLNIMREFLNEAMEARLCAEIDREYTEVAVITAAE